MDNRVRCSCTVDRLEKELWRVNVWGEAPHKETRSYTVTAKTDNFAAQEGMRRFVEEMSAR
jgi:hypothetical protein